MVRFKQNWYNIHYTEITSLNKHELKIVLIYLQIKSAKMMLIGVNWRIRTVLMRLLKYTVKSFVVDAKVFLLY